MIEAIELTSTRRSRGAGGEGGGPVENVSFDVYPGQVTALLGAPGAGKSTVLRMMVELEPGGGRTLFGGRPYRALRPAVREVGLALNPDAVHPGRTVQAHLALYSAAGGVPKPRLAEVLEVAGLSTQATVRCGRLDSGQRQRLAIAAALLGDPAVLILDEPHALDTHGMSWFHALIRAYAAQGRTVLVAATDPDTLAGTADHVIVLRRDENDGISRVIASRSAAEVFDERRATVVQVRSPQAARLAAALQAEGARLAPAGPGALQVRGLDRARIGEVAHIAGVCLHELCEIGHDDDLFGLRPLPRQKELAASRDRTEHTWRSSVRLVAADIEEAEVVETATQPSAEAAIEQPATIGAQASQHPTTDPRANVQPETGPATKPSVVGSWRTQGSVAGSRWSAVKGARPAQGSEERRPRVVMVGAQEKSAAAEPAGTGEQQGVPAMTHSVDGGPARITYVAAPPAASLTPAAATMPAATDSAAAPPNAAPVANAAPPNAAPVANAVPPNAAPVANALPPNAAPLPITLPAAPVTAMLPAATSPDAAVPAQSPDSAAAVLPTTAAPLATYGAAQPSPAPAPVPPPPAPSPHLTPTAPAKTREPHRRTSAFGRRWSRSRPQAPAPAVPSAEPAVAPASVALQLQPAVPFTVASAASGQAAAAGEGMTPWWAAAVRSSQHSQQQVSVAEAAPAEQDASA